MFIKDVKDYSDWIQGILKDTDGLAFRPFTFYNEDGDCVESFFKMDSYYAKRIDDYITLYLSDETDEVIGFVLKNVKELVNNLPARPRMD